MRKGGGAAKGSAFERDICKRLSSWWTQNEEEPRDDVFWRTAGSGGRATNRSKRGKDTANAYGDITFVDEIGAPLLHHCCFELKCGYGAWDVLDIFDKADPMLVKFWNQAAKSASQARISYPVVIAKRDRRRPIVLINRGLFQQLYNFGGAPDFDFIRFPIAADSLAIMTFDSWLAWANPLAFPKISKK